MRAGLDKHNGSCEHAAEAFLLNPIDDGLLRLDELWRIPVRPDESVATKRFRVHCARPAPDEEGELPDEEPPL